MKWLWKLSLITMLAFSALSGVHSPAKADHETTAADIMRMWHADLDDDAILTFVQSYRACLRLSSTDMANMAEEGVSDYLVSGLIDYMATAGPCNADGPYRVSRRYAPVFGSSYYFSLGVFPHWFYSDHHAHFYPVHYGHYYGGGVHYGDMHYGDMHHGDMHHGDMRHGDMRHGGVHYSGGGHHGGGGLYGGGGHYGRGGLHGGSGHYGGGGHGGGHGQH